MGRQSGQSGRGFQKPGSVRPKPQKPADAQAKLTEVLAKPVDAQAKPADTQVKPADAQAKPPDAQVKPGSAASNPSNEYYISWAVKTWENWSHALAWLNQINLIAKG